MPPDLVTRFLRDGFVAVRGAVEPETAAACRAVLWTELKERFGADEHDRSTWSRPVLRVNCPEGGPFVEAGTAPALWSAYDHLLGEGRWRKRRAVGGTVPVRFPSEDDPGDAGWHIDGSYDVDGEYWVNVHSRGRGLLALFLFTDVGEDDAPTRVLVGSHRDVPRVLSGYGERGAPFPAVRPGLPRSTFERQVALATGQAGDVFLCHPFLVHAASWPHRGSRARMMAQPEIAIARPFDLSNAARACPVERAIVESLT